MIHIIVTCTKKKHEGPEGPVHDGLKLSSVVNKNMDIEQRFYRWMDKVRNVPVSTMPAKDLYSGGHWSVVRSLYTDSNLDKRIWVSSAGHGLVEIDQEIKPYSATFSLKNADSVAVDRTGNQTWWRLHNCYTNGDQKDASSPKERSIEGIAQRFPEVPILVVASRNYLDALVDDVRRAKDTLVNPLNLSVISAGSHQVKGLSDQLISCDARFSYLVGGVRRSLNVGIGRLLLMDRKVQYQLSTGLLMTNVLRQAVEKVIDKGLPDLPQYNRVPQTDQEIKKFIVNKLEEIPDVSKTRLLRELRTVENKQCEQFRFSRLFQLVKNNLTESGNH